MNTQVYTNANEIRGFSVKNCPSMPQPAGVLMVSPDHYDVVDVKNPFMVGKAGTVDKALARAQWDALAAAYRAAGKTVKTLAPVEGLEDMVFCANPVFTGLTTRMEKICIPSHMRYPSRRKEVAAFEAFFQGEGYRLARLSDKTAMFEGMGDCMWHPGKRLLWGAHGFRTDPEVYPEIAQVCEAPVILLKLVNERFYHLDTCFCPLTQEAVLIYPSAFDAESLGLILKMFPIVLVAEENEAIRLLACNAAVVDSKTTFIQAGAEIASRHMRAIGLEVVALETSEFMKSGGSVFCLRQPFF